MRSIARLVLLHSLTVVIFVLPVIAGARQMSPSEKAFLDRLQSQHSDLDRYFYINRYLSGHPDDPGRIIRQFLAFSECELGLYMEAIRDFPVRNAVPPKMPIPDPDQWDPQEASAAIESLARDRSIVMVNEAHHDAQTRLLTIKLLPKLRALGFRYFAVEALKDDVREMEKRGYPSRIDGSEYLHEPLYGEMLREAMRLGYVIVPYEAHTSRPRQRELEQARNIFHRTFESDRDARVFIHAGYAHIDKEKARLGNVRPMAMELMELTGRNPLTVDQTDIREDSPLKEIKSLGLASNQVQNGRPERDPAFVSLLRTHPKAVMDPYHQIVAKFRPNRAIVLRARDGESYWSARPGVYDLSVILPLANSEPTNYDQGSIAVRYKGEQILVLPPANGGRRPDWVRLEGSRKALAISADDCRQHVPCLVEAFPVGESEAAVPSDRYVILYKRQKSSLFLKPGRYRIVASGDEGTIGTKLIRVD